MIPKIIHFCWFGKQKKSKEIIETIIHWKRVLPTYEFIEWNEASFDIEQMIYTKQAYASGKMAFVSDVARLYALYYYGGVYLDTDIEILRDFSLLLEQNKVLLGFENGGKHVMTAFMASKKNHKIWQDLLSYYEKCSFVDGSGNFDLTPNTTVITNYLEKIKLKKNDKLQNLSGGITIYPEEYFSAHDFKFMENHITDRTHTIHHCHASWMPKKTRLNFFIKKKVVQLIGHKNYKKLYLLTRKIKS